MILLFFWRYFIIGWFCLCSFFCICFCIGCFCGRRCCDRTHLDLEFIREKYPDSERQTYSDSAQLNNDHVHDSQTNRGSDSVQMDLPYPVQRPSSYYSGISSTLTHVSNNDDYVYDANTQLFKKTKQQII